MKKASPKHSFACIVLTLALCLGFSIPVVAGGEGEGVEFSNPQKLTIMIKDERGNDTRIRVTIDKVYEKYSEACGIM